MILKEILSMQPTISNLLTQKLPFSLAYKFSKLATKIDENVEFYSKQLRNLINEYAEKDEEGNIKYDNDNADSITVRAACIEEFQAKVNELQNIEVSTDFPSFTFSDFEDKIELSTQEVLTLMPIITEE